MENDFRRKFMAFCIAGNMNEIKNIDISNFEKNLNDLNDGFIAAAEHGNLEVIQYLLHSYPSKIDIHYYNDLAFKCAVSYFHNDILKFFILEMKIDKTQTIDQLLFRTPTSHAVELFSKRELYEKLNSEVNNLETIEHKTPKI